MFKKILFYVLVLLTTVLSACGPATLPVTPIATVSPTATVLPTSTPTPLPIIEVSNGKMETSCDIYLETTVLKFGLKISTKSIDFEIKRNESAKIMQIDSPYDSISGFQFCGFPDVPTDLANVRWGAWSGGLESFGTAVISVKALENAIPGIYLGKVVLIDLKAHSGILIDFKMTVLK